LTRDSLRMASSSVSQDDIDNDYEKNSRRSRIRTARARQINPSGSRADNNALPHDEAEEKALDIPASALHEEEEPVCDRQAENTEGPPQRGAEMGGADDTSPKPMCRAKDKRALPPSKMHHGNKGKQQRDRRKLREKRRSTGVVHLASTESTGGSTTGDDEAAGGDGGGGRDAACGGADSTLSQETRAPSTLLETRRNTQQNESIANSYRQAQEKLAQEVDRARGGANYPEPQGGSHYHHPTNGNSSNAATPSSHGESSTVASSPAAAAPTSSSSSGRRPRRDKSPSDLEADDENDHDSLNQSETGSNLSVNLAGEQQQGTGARRFPEGASSSGAFDQVNRENKRLANLVEEKDRRIHLLEYKVQQLMRDTLTISEEQSRLQKENTTLLRALSKLTKDKAATSNSSKN